MLYFAYGSNMSYPRMHQRLPEAERMGVASLQQYQFRYHKCGRDGSAKADILFTGKTNDQVYGVIYRLSDSALALLDKIEDYGIGYERKCIEVEFQGELIEAVAYIALHIDKSLKPFDWYHSHVIYGAKQANFPQAYIDFLEQQECLIDPNPIRSQKERAIYPLAS